MRFLNGFVLLGILLVIISAIGLIRGNGVISEPGQAVNTSAWLEYLGAGLLMFINGALTIKMGPRSVKARQKEGVTGTTAAAGRSDTTPITAKTGAEEAKLSDS